MKEIFPSPGEHLLVALKTLVEEAPAFMYFNGSYVEANVGDKADELFERWEAVRAVHYE